ncbi:hypothetical protein NE237_016432 [Protea cynaroides]|uniref:PGG domain-containing protein n=1 Tax=Protea cynaroides TaxID=273540 RepID=A0A9Q0HGZ2_9MAGN|nr:hypothetical protein NE237_016432 [Protea cynaroides]
MDFELIKVVSEGDIDGLKQLLEKDRNILHQVTPVGNTILHLAAKFGCLNFLEEVCDRCPSLIIKINQYGDTAIHVGARTDDLAVVSHLIDRMTSSGSFQLLKSQNNKGDSALHEALHNCHPHVAKLLIKKDPHLSLLVNKANESPLFLAVTKGYTDVVFHLLDSCPSASCDGPKGWTALHASMLENEGFLHPDELYHGRSTDHYFLWASFGLVGSYMTEKLLKVKPKLGRVVDIYGRTPFHYAVDTCNVLMVDLLLQHDASLAYIQDKNGWSPLHVAAHLWSSQYSEDDRKKVVEKIIQYCPDLEYLLDNRGNNVLHILMERVREDLYDNFFPGKLFRKFAQLKGLLNQRNNDGNTPLHLACLHGKEFIVSYLSNDSERIYKSRNNNNLTAFDIASYRAHKIEDGIHKSKVKEIPEQFDKWDRMSSFVSPKNQSLLPSRPQMWAESLNPDEFGERDKDEDDKREGELEEARKKLPETHMLVATLIATVAFAAAFQMPGGYESDSNSGRKKGMAVLAGEAALGFFVISDVTALSCSVLTVLLHFFAELTSRRRDPSDLRNATSGLLIVVAIVAMTLAFMFGVLAVLVRTHFLWIGILSVLICLLVAFFPSLLACFITICVREKIFDVFKRSRC